MSERIDAPPTATPRDRGPLVETTGIDIVPEAQRTARPRDLFWPWFAANVSVFGMSYGSFVLGFGVSFAQATFVTVVGVVLSFLLCGVVAVAGRHPHIGDHQVDPGQVDAAQCDRVGHRGHHLVPGPFQNPNQPLGQQNRVLRQYDAHAHSPESARPVSLRRRRTSARWSDRPAG